MNRLLIVLACSVCAWAQDGFRFTEVARGFTAPVDIQFPRDRSGRMFVVEQAGRIRLVKQGAVQATPFLDIRSRVASGGERGLLGMALAPNFRANGHFYVHYSDLRGDTVIARYTASSTNPDVVDPASEQIVLQAQQPAANHNGGRIAFGPDGYLYIGLGDGGGSNDQFQNAQNRRALLGKLLRIDVEGGAPTYSIPSTNPFVNDSSYRPEIWALGLRNPWRFSFDRDTGDLWIGDVGQDRAEEIDFQAASSKGGENYGWPVMEGLRCRASSTCANQGMVAPVHEYTRENGDASISGGYFYRGQALGLSRGDGFYAFADFVSGRIWGLRLTKTGVERFDVRGPGFNVSSFGEDPNGELYVADYAGTIFRLDNPAVVQGILNAATFERGNPSPGMIATAFTLVPLTNGEVVTADTLPLPFQLGGVQVGMMGRALPIYAVARNQINFQIPTGFLRNAYDITAGSSVTAASAILGTGSGGNPDATFPGVFSYATFREAIIVQNSDYTLATALEPNQDYFLYATGLGPVSNQPPLGEAAKIEPLSVMATPPTLTINGVSCPVGFAGLAPGFVGLYQINFRVSDSVPAGTHRLVLTAGGEASNGNWVHVTKR